MCVRGGFKNDRKKKKYKIPAGRNARGKKSDAAEKRDGARTIEGWRERESGESARDIGLGEIINRIYAYAIDYVYIYIYIYNARSCAPEDYRLQKDLEEVRKRCRGREIWRKRRCDRERSVHFTGKGSP